MSRIPLLATSLFIVISLNLYAVPKFPFPQNQNYPYGIKPAGADHKDVQAAYTVFLQKYYEESGNLARIKWDKPDQTVSEGIGYGMLVMVYMDNAANNTQPKFDKLWNYYNNPSFLDGQQLMHWKINGFSSVAEQNAATDGDIDVAFALTLAYKQWGDEKYKTAAASMISKIYQNEVNGNKYLKPGDVWDSRKNPSYFVTAALELFKKIDTQNDWTTVINNSYKLIKLARNATTGLVPDWCQENGSADGNGPDYKFDAARTPWRMACAYAWYGHADAKDVAGKMTGWIKSNTTNNPANIVDGYKLDGTKIGTYNIPAYIGPFACGGMVDAAHQDWVNSSYTKLASFIDDDNYYNESLQILSLLLLTGNALNLWEATPKDKFKLTLEVSPANSGTVAKSPDMAEYPKGTAVTITATPKSGYKFASWTGDLQSTQASTSVTMTYDMKIIASFTSGSTDLIDDCEDGDANNNLGGKWFTWNDSTSNGKSIVVPKTTPTSEFVMTAGGAGGTQKCAKITYTLDKGTNLNNPYVGVGFALNKTETAVDISKATGLTFYYKGGICDVRVECANVTDFGFYFKRLTASTDWVLTAVNWSDFAQPVWAKAVDFDRTKAVKISWQTPNTGKTGDAGEIWVDEIHLPGYEIVTITKTPDVPGVVNDFSACFLPFKSVAVINYSLHKSSDVKVSLYAPTGKLIRTNSIGYRQAGSHTENLYLHEAEFGDGMYIIRLQAHERSFTEKLMVIR